MTTTPTIVSVAQIGSSGLSFTISSPVDPIVGFQVEVSINASAYVPFSTRGKLEIGHGYLLFVGSKDDDEAEGERNTSGVILDGYDVGDSIRIRVRNLDSDDNTSSWVESALIVITEQVQSYTPDSSTPHNFNFFNSEFNLYDSLQNEIIKSRGIDAFYLPRQFQKVDLILGEDVLSKFNQSYAMKMYLASHTDFGGDGSVFGQFGLTVSEQLTLEVNINEFNTKTGNKQPVEGDLILLPLRNFVMEVFHVKDVDPFFHMGKPSKYAFETRKFEYTHEEMDTGIEPLDELETLESTDIDPEADEIDDSLNDILNSAEPTIFGDK